MSAFLAASAAEQSGEGLVAFSAIIFAVAVVVALAWLVLPFTIYSGVSRMNKTLDRIEILLRRK